jgi:hypothetical protein
MLDATLEHGEIDNPHPSVPVEPPATQRYTAPSAWTQARRYRTLMTGRDPHICATSFGGRTARAWVRRTSERPKLWKPSSDRVARRSHKPIRGAINR